MRILLIVDPDNPVPPVHYGGTERVADLLAREWSRLGHIVDLLAGPGSIHYNGRLHLHRSRGGLIRAVCAANCSSNSRAFGLLGT